MTVNEITNIANNYTDENFNSTVTINFVNSGISQINLNLRATLPLAEDTTSDYTALSDTWLLSVIVPYVCWSIKMNDGSLNEASMYYSQYLAALDELKNNKKTAIKAEYQGAGFKTSAEILQYRNQWGRNYRRRVAHSNDPLAQGDD
jgi:hypothetical protein